MNEREFNRRKQKPEMERVLGEMRKDAEAAKQFEVELGKGIPNLSKLGDPVPAPDLAERLTRPEPIPVAPVANLAEKRKEKEAERISAPEHVGNSQFVCLDVGTPPPGQPIPTHVKIGEVIYNCIPSQVFDDAVNMAFQRGFHRCLDVYKEVHKLMNVPPRIDPLQKSYVELVLEGFYND